MKKQKLIKKLNSETLFHSRKMYGMWGNIQWSVEDIVNTTLIIKISSSNTDWGEIQTDGSCIPSKEQIATNIENSVKENLPGTRVKAIWKEWKSKDGFGCVISGYGKTLEELASEMIEKMKDRGALEE